MYILEVSYGCPSAKYPSNGNFQLDQAKALAQIGHKVVFAALDMRSVRRWRRWGLWRHEAAGLDVYEYNFPMGPVAASVRAKLAERGFARILNRVIKDHGKPDVVHVHFADTAQSVVSPCKAAGVPFVVTEHASSIMDDAKAAPQRDMLKRVYDNAAAVIAVSPALARQIKKLTGADAAVVDDIVDIDTFCPTRHERGEGAPFRFVSAGHAEYRKGFDVLVAAFAKLIKTAPDCELVIMGDGAELDNIKRDIAARGLDDKVTCTGYFKRAEFAEALNNSDGFVLASRHETFGVVYAEAMAAGVPVIATRCGGTEGFVNAQNGLMVDVDDVPALAEAMAYMRANADKFDRAAIARYARESFAPAAVAAKITAELERAIQ